MATKIVRWTARRWSFDFPPAAYPCILERLRGTPARVQELLADAGGDLRVPSESTWSVFEHCGHLSDLEALLATRLDAYERGDDVLPPADLDNPTTNSAGHAQRQPQEIVAELRTVRAQTMERLESYPAEFFATSAWHERLGLHKRVVDTCYFFAEHDDQHLAVARSILAHR